MSRTSDTISKEIGLYIHIPFCTQICSYCDFCKMFYYEKWVDAYLDALKEEIDAIYQKEVISTLYIGGGTPSCLSLSQLQKLFSILKKFPFKNSEFTFECNIEIEEEKLKFLKENGVNRISIGIQTIHPHHLKNLHRFHTKEEINNKIKKMKEIGFDNINVDLMYALPNETIEEVKEDLEFLLSLSIQHISTYSLMIEPHTVLGIQNVVPLDEEVDANMYEIICTTLKKHGFHHYEISNFALPNYESKHNLTYWNNESYYGCGLGASGYVDGVRYTNTRSFQDYLKGNRILEKHTVTKQEQIENTFILGLRKIDGISVSKFLKQYDLSPLDMPVVKRLLQENKLILKDDFLKIHPHDIYISNLILVQFLND